MKPSAASPSHLIAIGASSGSHESLKLFFKYIPEGLPAAFVVVTHLRRDHHTIFHDIVATYTRMPVCKIESGMMIQSGRVYVMPEDVYLNVEEDVFILVKRPEGIQNQSVDYFLTHWHIRKAISRSG